MSSALVSTGARTASPAPVLGGSDSSMPTREEELAGDVVVAKDSLSHVSQVDSKREQGILVRGSLSITSYLLSREVDGLNFKFGSDPPHGVKRGIVEVCGELSEQLQSVARNFEFQKVEREVETAANALHITELTAALETLRDREARGQERELALEQQAVTAKQRLADLTEKNNRDKAELASLRQVVAGHNRQVSAVAAALGLVDPSPVV